MTSAKNQVAGELSSSLLNHSRYSNNKKYQSVATRMGSLAEATFEDWLDPFEDYSLF